MSRSQSDLPTSQKIKQRISWRLTQSVAGAEKHSSMISEVMWRTYRSSIVVLTSNFFAGKLWIPMNIMRFLQILSDVRVSQPRSCSKNSWSQSARLVTSRESSSLRQDVLLNKIASCGWLGSPLPDSLFDSWQPLSYFSILWKEVWTWLNKR